VKPPEPWLGRLLIAWAEDPDGHLIQVVQSVVEFRPRRSPGPGRACRPAVGGVWGGQVRRSGSGALVGVSSWWVPVWSRR
jgi:hypothetical protein